MPVEKQVADGWEPCLHREWNKGGSPVKRGKRAVFFVVLLCIAVLGYASFLGVSNTYGDLTRVYVKGAGDIQLGMDLRGGVEVVFGPPEGVDATEAELRLAQAILERRLLSQDITDGEVYTDFDQARILVRYPADVMEGMEEDLSSTVAELGETAQLTLREGSQRDENNRPSGVTKETVILTSKDVVSASVEPSQKDVGQYVVLLDLTEEGAAKFNEASERLSGTDTTISIWLDDTMISAPSADTRMLGGKPAITGRFTQESAARLADKINLGPMPFRMRVVSYGPIAPALGEGARGILAKCGILAFGLTAALLVFRCRLPGVVAMIALFGQAALLVAAVTGFIPQFPATTLSLPSIAAMLLALWFGIDTNVHVAEGIKEGLRDGKNLDAAVDFGFRQAFPSLWNGCLLTALIAFLLLAAFSPESSLLARLPFLDWLGTASSTGISSFGFVLLAGALSNLAMNGFASRLMLKSLCRMKALRDPSLYGGGRR